MCTPLIRHKNLENAGTTDFYTKYKLPDLGKYEQTKTRVKDLKRS